MDLDNLSLMEMFDKWLLEREPKEKKSHWASEIFSCPRKQFYKWTCPEDKPEDKPATIIKYRSGNLWELEYSKFMNWIVDKEVKVFGKVVKVLGVMEQQFYSCDDPILEHPIHGYVDFVLVVQNGELIEEIGIELKTSFGINVINIQKSGKTNIYYLDQIWAYSQLSGIKFWIHPFIGRDFGYRTEFQYYIADDGIIDFRKNTYEKRFPSWQETLKNIQNIEMNIRTNIEPERPDGKFVPIKDGQIKEFQHKNKKYKAERECSWCDFREKCWKDEVEKYKRGNNAEPRAKVSNIPNDEKLEELIKTFVWTTSEGEKLRLREMETSHIFNCMKMEFNHLAKTFNLPTVWFQNKYWDKYYEAEKMTYKTFQTIVIFVYEIERKRDLPEKYIPPYKSIVNILMDLFEQKQIQIPWMNEIEDLGRENKTIEKIEE